MDIIGNSNIRTLWDSLSELYRDNTALIYEDKDGNKREYTYEEFNIEINRTANMFLSMGIEKGDKVAIKLCNSPEFLMCWYGANKIGAVMVPVNTHYTDEEFEFIINSCDAVLCVTDYGYLPAIKSMQNTGKISKDLKLIITETNEDVGDALSFYKLLEKQQDRLMTYVDIDSSDVAEILFTSGTTSCPKGAMITHYNLLFAGHYTAWQGKITDKDRYMTTMPAFHVDFQCTAAMPSFTVGATFIMIEKYSASKFWRQVVDYKATITECIPFTVRTLLSKPKNEWEREHNLREIFYYLCMCEEEKNAFIDRFNVRLLNSYGMTETIVGLIGDVPGRKRKWPSIGQPGLCYEARIVNEDGIECKPLEQGEIQVKGIPGKTLFKGYYKNEEATKKTFTEDGYLKTNDIGYMDEEGYFFFLDRNVNMIKRSGENISCTEIENVIESHPKVEEVAVIGVKDDIYDEVVKAFVVLNHGETLTLEELQSYCSDRLAPFKIPVYLEVIKEFPKTATGKIQKKYLKKDNA